MMSTSTVRWRDSERSSVDSRSCSSSTWLTGVLLDRRPRPDACWGHPTTASGGSVEAELVAFRGPHHDEAAVERTRRVLAHHLRSDPDELPGFGLQRSGPVGSAESGSRPDFEV